MPLGNQRPKFGRYGMQDLAEALTNNAFPKLKYLTLNSDYLDKQYSASPDTSCDMRPFAPQSLVLVMYAPQSAFVIVTTASAVIPNNPRILTI